jgi:hypothetical protein
LCPIPIAAPQLAGLNRHPPVELSSFFSAVVVVVVVGEDVEFERPGKEGMEGIGGMEIDGIEGIEGMDMDGMVGIDEAERYEPIPRV